MTMLEVLLAFSAAYFTLLLLLEVVVWKTQPNMENAVTLFVPQGDSVLTRKLYGFDYNHKLYVSSNHWFRHWYHAILRNPQIDVEHAGNVKPYTIIPIEGDERAEIAREYKMGFVLRLMCGFAPRRFLRLDPMGGEDGV
ncbi:MAG: hypothetical protein GKR90_17765 [Pseudomonadales bacterium]|nr:hypothetical protein [Pseudomonadales bacterium]